MDMNIIRIQKDYVAKLIKDEQVVFCSGMEGKVGVSDSHACYFIPEKQMFLDKKDKGFFDAKRILRDYEEGAKLVIPTEHLKDPDGIPVQRFDSEDEDSKIFVFVQEKYLTYFGKDVRYYAINPRYPLFVVTDDDAMEMLAFIMPKMMNYSEEP